jgi:hypothetical protein
MESIPEDGRGRGAGIPPRKRSIGSSHLDVSSWGATKSRRTTPSPGPGGLRSGFGGFDDDDDDFQNVIDLTG